MMDANPILFREGKYIISKRIKTIQKYNPISGHWWTENIKQKGFEVSGGEFFTTYKKTLKAAKEEIVWRKRFTELIERCKNNEKI